MNELEDSSIQHILVLEDDIIFQKFYEIFFAKLTGVELHLKETISDVNLFLTEFSGTLDGAILDNQVSDGEGLTLLPILKQQFPLIAVIMASGNEDYKFFLRAFSEGVDDYIRKPINMDLLWLKLKKSVKLLRLQDENANQSLALSRWQQAQLLEQKLASHLMTAMLGSAQSKADAVKAYVAPSTLFSGDSVISIEGPDGSLYVLLADAMGHGLAAAVSLMPMVQAFSTMARKGLPLQNTVFEINRLLNDLLTNDRFVAGVFLRFQPEKNLVECWNGGMPSVWGFDSSFNKVIEFRSKNMALGVLSDSMFSATTEHCSLEACDTLFVCSDGLLEAPNLQQEEFTDTLLSRLVAPTGHYVQALKQYINEQLTEIDDDISFVTVSLPSLLNKARNEEAVPQQVGSVLLQATASGQALKDLSIANRFVEMVQDFNLPIDTVQKLFTVLTELTVNALEHGILELDSALKNGDNGFLVYYEEKERRLQKVTEEDCLEVSIHYFYQRNELVVQVTDSGKGFLTATDSNDSQVSGRGLALLHKLCNSVEVKAPGNQVVAIMKLS